MSKSAIEAESRYTIRKIPDLSDLKNKLKTKRLFVSEEHWYHFKSYCDETKGEFSVCTLTDYEALSLKDQGFELEKQVAGASECDCGYCNCCIEKEIKTKTDALTNEEKLYLDELKAAMAKINSDAEQSTDAVKQVWGLITSPDYPYA